VGTESETSHAADNVARKIKTYVSRKGVWRMCDHGPPGREGTPLMVSGAFALALSWIYLRCPIIKVPLPEELVVKVRLHSSIRRTRAAELNPRRPATWA